jgi:hypothetical protein
VSLGASGSARNNGLLQRIADGRSSGVQSHADRQHIRKVLGLGNAG